MTRPTRLPRRREDLADFVCQMMDRRAVRLIDKAKGWPALIQTLNSTGWVQVALHVGPIGTFSRQPYELRFQNLADPSLLVAAPGNSFPALVGVDAGSPPVLVVVDGRNRIGKPGRFSLLFHARLLREARNWGWSEYISSTGERFLGVVPQLFPVAVEVLLSGVTTSSAALGSVALAAGLIAAPTSKSAERARRAALIIVRDAKFSAAVRKVYHESCAMCGLSIELVEGAHILPVSAPGSTDHVTNGVALCRNHHRAFDSHRLYVDPCTYDIRQHPMILGAAANEHPVKVFSSGTYKKLALTKLPGDRPDCRMLQARVDLFKDEYDWT